jgi:hypothetical protein
MRQPTLPRFFTRLTRIQNDRLIYRLTEHYVLATGKWDTCEPERSRAEFNGLPEGPVVEPYVLDCLDLHLLPSL